MSSDIITYDEELQDLCSKAEAIIVTLSDTSRPKDTRLGDIDKLSKIIKNMNTHFHDFSMELRISEFQGAEKARYESKRDKYTDDLRRFKEEHLNKKRMISLEADTADAREPFSPTEGQQDDGKGEARDITRRIGQIQNKTLMTLTEAERTAEQTDATADSVTIDLKKDTEKMQNINANLDELEGEVDRAKKELNAFIRRMMTDKIIICFAVLVGLGIILIVVFNFVIKKKETGGASTIGNTTTVTK
eukprot:Tbor_TRINITY_DN5431_c1_g1::TRINITY_DN5431_c1_g1_i3::g.24767::m.24767